MDITIWFIFGMMAMVINTFVSVFLIYYQMVDEDCKETEYPAGIAAIITWVALMIIEVLLVVHFSPNILQ